MLNAILIITLLVITIHDIYRGNKIERLESELEKEKSLRR
jgi:hypothetical protein